MTGCCTIGSGKQKERTKTVPKRTLAMLEVKVQVVQHERDGLEKEQ